MKRREFLQQTGSFVGGALLARMAAAAPALAMPAAGGRKTRRVLFVAFAGGVRSRETILAPQNVPNLMALAERGTVFPATRVMNVGHFGATLSLFTGCTEYMGIRENTRGFNPTLFEYVRKQLKLPASDVWLSTTAGAQQLNFSYGLHKDYGPAYGANVIAGDGLFNADLTDAVTRLGSPRALAESEEALVLKLRSAMRPDFALAAGERLNDQEAAARIERYLLNEITGHSTRDLTGPGAADAKAIRVGASILQLFRPRLLGIVLGEADTAHGSYNRYVEIIRRNDEELGKLFKLIDKDQELSDSTAVFLLPEFGRDKDLNQRNGLDHGDQSDELLKVAMIAAGPDFPRGKTATEDIASIDVCPTIGALLGVKTPQAQGGRLKKLVA
ncbi:MAG: hypothetical protein U1E76_28215 [Planctomycetota bacterium]